LAATEKEIAGLKMPDTATPDRIYFRFIRLHHRVFAEMGRTLKPTGLSIPQFDVLSTLTEQQGLSQSDLATRLYVTKGNVSGLIDRLVDAGFVERRSTPGDRRSNALFLTETGRKAAEEGLRLQKAFVAETLAQLPERDLGLLDGIITSWRDAVRRRADGA
jgi:MarR family transcriptional regulator, organic hydroperoxide resistance regulator